MNRQRRDDINTIKDQLTELKIKIENLTEEEVILCLDQATL